MSLVLPASGSRPFSALATLGPALALVLFQGCLTYGRPRNGVPENPTDGHVARGDDRVVADAQPTDPQTTDPNPGDPNPCPGGLAVNAGGVCCPSIPAGYCGYTCTLNAVTNTHNCVAPVTVTSLAASYGTATIDMTGYTSLLVSFDVCDPTGFLVHVADSPTCDGYSGDGGQFANDAEVHLNSTNLDLFGNGYTPGDMHLSSTPDVVLATGCSSRTILLADQKLRAFDPCIDATSEYALRINPPADAEGPPDALWYLGLNRTVGDAGRNGTGLQSVTLCLRP